jgi:predicted CXXCH cytochrome family protein
MAITGKQLSRRIDRNYSSALDPSILWKRRFGWAGLLFGVVYGLWMLSPSAAKQLSTGTLSKAHHAWNETGCDNCHAPLSPIKTTSVARSPHAIAENNQRCNACHRMADHYPTATKPALQALESCVQCHHEHLGANHNLLDIADESCVRCHADLAKFVTDADRPLSKVTSFDSTNGISGHPDFQGLIRDPGTIQFSHTQHMRPGQSLKPGDLSAKTWDSLPLGFQDQYQKPNNISDPIQLTCSDCHERDYPIAGYKTLEGPNATSASNSLDRQTNAHVLYKPVEFSKHCEACHQLDLPHKLDFKDQKHLLDIVATSQQQRLARSERLQSTSNQSESSVDEENRLRIAGTASGADLVGLIKENNPLAKTAIFKTYACSKCHQPATDLDSINNLESIVVPSSLPTQWLKKAVFSHGPHINVQCDDCHKIQLDSNSLSLGNLASDVLIDGIHGCQQCHIVDETKRRDAQLAGVKNIARADCIDCHRYHDHGPQGPATGIGQTGTQVSTGTASR